MDIFINEEKLEIQMEHEKNVKEVIEGINTWLFKNSKVVDKIVIDGKIYNQEIESLEHFDIDQVHKMELTVIDIKELVYNSLMETKKYLEEISKYIQGKDEFSESDMERMTIGLNWTLNILNRTNKIYNYENLFTTEDFNFLKEYDLLDKLKQKLENLMVEKKVEKINQIIKTELGESVNQWCIQLEKLISNHDLQITDIHSLREKISQQIYKIVTKIPDMQKLIEMIVADFQTGHQKEAMTNIQIILGTLESIIALLQLIKSTFSMDYHQLTYENQSIEEFNKNMNDVLKEMFNAIHIKDVVLITDLLTYELIPKLEIYNGILKLIAKELNIEIN